MIRWIAVAAGGAAGSVLRYGIGLLPVRAESGFPVKTFLINVIGSFAIGLIAARIGKESVSENMALFLKVGLCGGFTTFSSFALETQDLVARGEGLTAALYVAASMIFGVAAVALAGRFA